MNDYIDELIHITKELDLKISEFVLLGGSSLDFAGIRKHRDIDICVIPSKKETVLKKIIGKERVRNIKGKTIKISDNVEINKGNVFEYWGISDEELINNSKYFHIEKELRIVRIEMIFSKKLYRCTKLELFRFKDLYDVFLIMQAKDSLEFWNDKLVLYPNSDVEEKMAKRIVFFSMIYGQIVKLIKRVNNSK